MLAIFMDAISSDGIPLVHARVCLDCQIVFKSKECPRCGRRNAESLSIIGGQTKLPQWKTVRQVWDRAKRRLSRQATTK